MLIYLDKPTHYLFIYLEFTHFVCLCVVLFTIHLRCVVCVCLSLYFSFVNNCSNWIGHQKSLVQRLKSLIFTREIILLFINFMLAACLSVIFYYSYFVALKRYEYFNYINLLASIVVLVFCIIIQLTFLHFI